MNKQIASVQNPFIKKLFQLKEKSRDRKKSGLFLIEGKRELSLAIKGNYTIETLLFYHDLFSETEANALSHYNIDIIEITKEVYQKLAHRDTTEGVIAVAKTKELSLNNLKIDISFIRLIGEDESVEEIIKLIINLAHVLGLKTIAEGIETQQQLDFLKLNKCDYGQGYFFSKPITIKQLKALIKS